MKTSSLADILREDIEQPNAMLGEPGVSSRHLLPGERRTVAILFLDLHGFTALSELLDHEVVHRMATGVMKALSRVVEAHGGYVDKFEGDRIMALFGADEAHENDCVRAVSCGLRMLETIEELGPVIRSTQASLAARVGIAYGNVTVAPDAAGHTTATGDEVNVASRMESGAEVGTVRVTGRVHSECGSVFEWLDLGEAEVRGRSVPVHAYRPLGPGAEQRHRWGRSAGLRSSPLVGRERELGLLREAVREHMETGRLNRLGGRAHLVLQIIGEAGTGKSRLANELIEAGCGLGGEPIVLRGSARSFSQRPFWLWTEVLGSLRTSVADGSSEPAGLRSVLEGISEACPERHAGRALRDSIPYLTHLESGTGSHQGSSSRIRAVCTRRCCRLSGISSGRLDRMIVRSLSCWTICSGPMLPRSRRSSSWWTTATFSARWC